MKPDDDITQIVSFDEKGTAYFDVHGFDITEFVSKLKEKFANEPVEPVVKFTTDTIEKVSEDICDIVQTQIHCSFREKPGNIQNSVSYIRCGAEWCLYIIGIILCMIGAKFILETQNAMITAIIK